MRRISIRSVIMRLNYSNGLCLVSSSHHPQIFIKKLIKQRKPNFNRLCLEKCLWRARSHAKNQSKNIRNCTLFTSQRRKKTLKGSLENFFITSFRSGRFISFLVFSECEAKKVQAKRCRYFFIEKICEG
jgi:hypothetical protein